MGLFWRQGYAVLWNSSCYFWTKPTQTTVIFPLPPVLLRRPVIPSTASVILTWDRSDLGKQISQSVLLLQRYTKGSVNSVTSNSVILRIIYWGCASSPGISGSMKRYSNVFLTVLCFLFSLTHMKLEGISFYALQTQRVLCRQKSAPH